MRRFLMNGNVWLVKDNQITADERVASLSEQEVAVSTAKASFSKYSSALSQLLSDYEKTQLELSELSDSDDAYDEVVIANESAKLAYEAYIDTSYETGYDSAVLLYDQINSKKPAAPVGAVELTNEQLERHLSDDYEFDVEAGDFIGKTISDDELAVTARTKRDDMINDNSWRYERYASETRLHLKPTDSIEALDQFTQALRDITKQERFPTQIDWPELASN